MNSLNVIGKAIWRKPGEQNIHGISSHQGLDEFLIAPYEKQGEVLCLKGLIQLLTPTEIIEFLQPTALQKSTKTISTSKDHYIDIVNKAVSAIQNKQFEKVVLARQLLIENKINLPQLFLKLSNLYPNAFVYAFVLNDGFSMIGATPETLLERKENALKTEALGGTEQSYGYSEKEYTEHTQIIDDIQTKLNALDYRFTIGKTAPKKAGNVSHLSTEFTILCKSMEADLNLLQKLHPTAAIAGLPYENANQFLLQNEDFKRQYYAGYLGIKQNNHFSFYVNLRCAQVFDDGAILYAGAGINKDSNAENEWMETTQKINTLLSQIN